MTDKEKAVIMAYTGYAMLTGDKFSIFHKYVEDLMGRPVYTHELGISMIQDELHERSLDDFLALCRGGGETVEQPNCSHCDYWNFSQKIIEIIIEVMTEYGLKSIEDLQRELNRLKGGEG